MSDLAKIKTVYPKAFVFDIVQISEEGYVLAVHCNLEEPDDLVMKYLTPTKLSRRREKFKRNLVTMLTLYHQVNLGYKGV